MATFENLDALKGAVGQHLGYGEWIEVTQDRIDKFADATDDHQWIHVDPDAAAKGPFGATIAHGYLTLSLASLFLSQRAAVGGISLGINYGVNKARFPAPVPVGSKVRGGCELVEVDDIPGGVQAVIRVTIETEGSEKPACVVDTVTRYLA
ncbi:MAG: MaoC family dehydratase [Acidimicrobiia bacterium]